MLIKNNLHLKEIKRFRVSEGRDLEKGLRLDRNEKVDLWPDNFINKVLSSKPKSFFSTYPEISSLYEKLSNFNNVSTNQILITSGIDGSIKNLFSVLLNEDDNIGVFSPTYLMYKVYSSIYKVNCFQIGYSEDYKINQSELEKFFTLNPKILFVPNPNQPIESSLSLSELKDLAIKCKTYGCFLVIDEAYYHLGSDTGISLIKDFDNVIILRTFSKAFGVPSIRTGYTVSSEENMDIISKMRPAHEMNSVSIAIAEYLLDNIDQVMNYCEKIKTSRNLILKDLKDLDLNVRGQHGNYILITFKSQEIAKNLVKFLKEELIYVKGPYLKPWNMCICFTVGPQEYMKKFLSRMKEAKKEKIF